MACTSPPSLLDVSLRVVCQSLVYDGQTLPGSPTYEYLINLLKTELFTSVSESILSRMVEHHARYLSDRCVQVLCPPHLRHLRLTRCTQLTWASVKHILTRLHSLQSLDLSFCEQLMSPDLDLLADLDLSSTLTSVSLEECSTLSDFTVQTVLRRAKSLRSVNISGCESITDQVFLLNAELQLAREAYGKTSSEYECQLTSVDISGCASLTSTAVRHLVTLTGPTLRSVNLSCLSVDCVAFLYLCRYGLASAISVLLSDKDGAGLEEAEELAENLRQLKSLQAKQYQRQTSGHESGQHRPSGVRGQQNGGGITGSACLLSEQKKIELSETEISCKTQGAEHGYSPTDSVTRGSSFQEATNSSGFQQVGDDGTGITLHEDRTEITSSEKTEKDASRLTEVVLEDFDEITTALGTFVNDSFCIEELEAPICRFEEEFERTKKFVKSKSENYLESAKYDISAREGGKLTQAAIRSPAKVTSLPDVQCKENIWFKKIEADVNQTRPAQGQTSVATADTDHGHVNAQEPIRRLPSNPVNLELTRNTKTVITIRQPPHTADSPNDNGLVDETRAPCGLESVTTSADEPDKGVQEHRNCWFSSESGVSGTPKTCVLPSDTPTNDQKQSTVASSSKGISKVFKTDSVPHSHSEPVILLKDGDPGSFISLPGDLASSASSPFKGSDDSQPIAHSSSVNCREKKQLDAYQEDVTTYLTPVQMYTPDLVSLELGYTDLNETAGKCLEILFQHNKNIRRFHIHSKFLTNEMISSIVTNGVLLEEIALVDGDQVTCPGIQAIGNQCGSLWGLDLKGVCFITDAALWSCLSRGLLRHISLAECGISDVTLKWISQKVSGTLESLDLAWCDEITEWGVTTLLSADYPNLHTLSLHQGPASDHTLSLIADHCRQLTKLVLCGVRFGIEDDSVVHLAECLPQLEKIDISWNSGLTDRSTSAFLTCCPKLQFAHFEGLKRISSDPFLKLIADEGKWLRNQSIMRKYQLQKQRQKCEGGQVNASTETRPVPLPIRSSVFAPALSYLSLVFCDLVDDFHLAGVAAVCRGSLTIQDYHGQVVQPLWFAQCPLHVSPQLE